MCALTREMLPAGAAPHAQTFGQRSGPATLIGGGCLNCRREVHHGAEGEEENRALQERLGALEY